MKTVLITGASSGIGKATALYFAKRGWHVIATMRKKPKKKIKNITFEILDVTKSSTIKAVQSRHPNIDVLVNNAGYGLFGAIETCTDKEIQKQFDTNVFGVMRMIKEFLPAMRQRNGGMIVNVSSMVGKFTIPKMGYYNATKYAVESLTEALWHELYKTNLRVKLIEPGFITTEFSKRSKIRGSRDIAFYNKKEVISKSANGSNPKVIAKLIFKAATSNNKKLRYHAGKFSSTALLARKLLPDWIFLRLVQLRE